MAFTQDLFTSRRNQDDGNIRIGETDRIWYDSNRNGFYISDGATPGGILVGTGGGNGNVITNNYGNVNVAAYIDTFITPQLYSNVNLIAYLSSVTFGGNLDLGNLYITDETIGGKIADRDITLSPAGAGLVATPGIKMSVGSVVQGVSNIVAVITSTTINQVSRYSTGPSDNLNIGDYGLTNGVSGVTPGWAVYQAYGNVQFGNTIQVGDSFIGAGIPVNSTVLFVGNTSGTDPANANIIITTYTLNGLPPLAANTTAYTTRAVVNAGLAITTQGNTDITFNPGVGGNIVPAGSIIPLVSSVYNLGTPTRRFKELWLGAGTIYVQDETLGTDQAIGARDGNLYIAGGAGLTVGKFTLVGNTIALNNPNEEFFIGSQQATANLVINRPMSVRSPGTDFTTFSVQRDGLTTIHAPVNLGNTRAVLSIIGSSSGSIQPRNFANTMVQVTGQDNVPNRISFDAFGVSAGQNSYVAVSARAARGNVDVPTTTQAGDTILRFTAQGWTGNGLFAGSIIRLNLEAAETFTSNLKTGTRLTIQTTPIGSNLIQTTAAFYSNGMNLYGNTISTGITFADGSFQNTAVRFGDTVRKITTGVGFANPGAYQGNVSLDTTDVHTLATDSYSLTITDTGSNNLRLQLAQEISANSNPIFNNLTVSNLTVNGTFTTAINATINGKILYLANNSTSASQIDGGGIILGNVQQSYYKSILYDLANNWWDTDGSGLNTEFLSAHDADFAGNIDVTGTGRFGGAYTGYNFPNAGIQVFENVNSYAQVVEQNLSNGTNATTDFIATADNGTDTTYYIDMGIAGSGYDNNSPYNSLGTSINANDGYLYVQGDMDADAAVDGGDLVIGTATGGKIIKFIVGGVNDTNVKVTFSNTTIDSYNNYVLHDGNDNILLQLQNDGGIGKLTFTGGSQGIWYNGGIYINGVTHHDSYYGIQALSYNSATGQVTYGQIDASQILNAYGNTNVAAYLAGNVTIGNLTVTTNVTAGNVIANKNGVFNANVYTNYIVASGKYLTELPGYAYSNANVNSYLSITTNSPGAESLTLSNGVFTFTPANLAIYAWSSNVANANVAMKGYVDSTIASNVSTINNSITTANTAMKGYVDSQISTVTTNWTANANSQQVQINNLANSTISGVALNGNLFNLTAGNGIAFSSGTTYNGSAAITINSTPTGVDAFTSNVTTQITTLAVDMTNGPTMIFWQPSSAGDRAITLSNFTAGRRVKIFITPKANPNKFTFTGVTASQCSNGLNNFVLGGGGVAQSSMMIEVLSTTSAIGGVWIFGFGSQ